MKNNFRSNVLLKSQVNEFFFAQMSTWRQIKDTSLSYLNLLDVTRIMNRSVLWTVLIFYNVFLLHVILNKLNYIDLAQNPTSTSPWSWYLYPSVRVYFSLVIVPLTYWCVSQLNSVLFPCQPLKEIPVLVFFIMFFITCNIK
jgi:hypothetical protein